QLKENDLALGVVTRNGRASVARALENFESITAEDFGVLVTRDVPVAPKPAPDPVLYALGKLGVAPGRAVFVGDNWLDVEAGVAAGAVTVLLENSGVAEEARKGAT